MPIASQQFGLAGNGNTRTKKEIRFLNLAFNNEWCLNGGMKKENVTRSLILLKYICIIANLRIIRDGIQSNMLL